MVFIKQTTPFTNVSYYDAKTGHKLGVVNYNKMRNR